MVAGQVQGVGFRPFIYRLALDHKLTGFVCNTPEGVVIELQGEAEAIDAFAHDFPLRLPPLAHVTAHTVEVMETIEEEENFSIHASVAGDGHHVLISPDIATCPDCLADMHDANNRRYVYPFTNCTNCGPRYTITRSIPYDRATTSMACFPLCPDCHEEYTNPLDRRFHAQPNACPVCGPHVWFADEKGVQVSRDKEAFIHVVKALNEGHIAAIKGLGGFHLVADARNDNAVATLRERKHRPFKPLAIMVADVNCAHQIAHISVSEEALLSGRERPIVLLKKRAEHRLSKHTAPHTAYIGMMLPYTPLHHVLFQEMMKYNPDVFPALVMTSGNAGGEPICLGNREAVARLSGIADFFLFHNRDILVRVDDSVTRIINLPREKASTKIDDKSLDTVQFIRRARGFTPSPIAFGRSGPNVIGLGPQLKTTVCFTKDDNAFLSQHIGDLENLETYEFYKEVVSHMHDILKVDPQAAVCDLHPDYMTSVFAHEQNDWPVFKLQHHFAHLYAVMAENQCYEKTVGLCLDGTGLGDDETIWGGECLCINPTTTIHTRLGRLDHIRLPGGEAAIREPWRIARAVLTDIGEEGGDWPWTTQFHQADMFLQQMLERDIRCPKTSSCGRLFDAVSALLGVCLETTYEGQAAIMLETLQQGYQSSDIGAYRCPVSQDEIGWRLESTALIQAIVEDIQRKASIEIISRRFHNGLADGLTELACLAAQTEKTRHIGLSGGVMLNQTLFVELYRKLKSRGYVPLIHSKTSPGDGCISLGQAFYGRLRLLQ